MTQKNFDQSVVRRYLIDPLSGNEKESIEDRLLADEEFVEELEITENELIDEYLADELSPHERENFEKYFLAHPARREKVEGTRILKRYLDTVPAPSPQAQPISIFARLLGSIQPYFFSSPRGLAVSVPLVLIIAGGVWLIFIRQSELQKGLEALNDAYRSERPIESRVSNLDHAEFISRLAPGDFGNVDKLKRDQAYIYLSTEYEKRHDAASAHALGEFHLLQKDPNQAIRYLEEARAGDPNNPQIYTDLGAAYFEKGKQQADNSPPNKDWAESIIHLNKALELDPNLLAALFNRALVYQYQGMDHLAETDWRLYLRKDSNSPWSIEAQRKLKELEEKKATSSTSDNSFEKFMQAYRAQNESGAWEIYRNSHTPRGNTITKALLSKILADKTSRNEHVDALNYLGQLELRLTHDTYTSHLSEVYRSAAPDELALLGQAREQLDTATKLFSLTKLGEAKELLVTARDSFIKLNDLPETLLAEAALAHAATLEPDLDKAQKLFARIIPQCEAHRYNWFTAQTLSNRAHMESNRSNYSQAIIDANQALSMFQELDDPNGTLGSFTQLASFHYSVKDIEISFSYLRRARAIAEAMRAPPPGDIWGIHITTALNLTALKLYGAALDHQNEALKIALELDKPLLLSRSYQNIGITYGYLKQFEPALKNLRLAYDQGKRVEKEVLGKNMMANASLKLGDFYRVSGDAGAAVAAYDESLRLYDLLQFFHYSYAAHKGKFLAYLSQQNDALADQELQLVLKLFDEYRQKIRNERQKTHFFDSEQDIYDLAIDFAFSRLGNRRRAFEYSEISRARNLRELMVNGAQVMKSDSGLDLQSAADVDAQSVKQTTAEEIEHQLPNDVQVVEFAVLEKKVLIWHISKAGIVPTEVPVESATLTKAVATTLEQIQKRDEPGATASLKNLYRLIIEPIADKLDRTKVLCLVPDKALHYLPWGALISGSGRYLFQDFRWLTSPSATIFIDSTNKARARGLSPDEHLLAVGNPSFDRAAYPDLSNLPGAEREVEKIATNYPAAIRRLIGPKATRKSVLSELSHADVIHFAAHYEVDPRSTLASRLLLAQPPGERSHAEPAALTAADIYGLNLSRTRLVVLSGCNTAIERDFAGEGPIGFARSFLVANVPVVVASLWPVDSDATSLLMIEFHRLRKKEQKPTTEALMRAQAEILKRPGYENPYYWAGFMVVGGHASY
jgi:CHAT domain-containing protein